MKKKIMVCIIILLIIMNQWSQASFQVASAAMKNGEMVTLYKAGQVLETITFHGKTVEAVYSNESYVSSDLTYSCAAFIKKFYYEIYGIRVYNLSTTSSIPMVYDDMGSFSQTKTPQVGDIVRDNARTHWAIVKAIKDSTITVIQQNYKSGNSAWINCSIEINDARFTYFTYSDRIREESNTDFGTGQTVANTVPESLYDNTKEQIQTPTQLANAQEVIAAIGIQELVNAINIQESAVKEANASVPQDKLTPSVTISNKTLYTNYKSYKIKVNHLSDDDQLFFKSSDTTVVKVSKKGTLTPIRKGIADITVVIKRGDSTYQQTVKVNVKDPYIKIANLYTQVFTGDIIPFNAKTYGISGSVLWSLSDENMASIDRETGLFVAKKEGTVTIFAECSGTVKAKVEIAIQTK